MSDGPGLQTATVTKEVSMKLKSIASPTLERSTAYETQSDSISGGNTTGKSRKALTSPEEGDEYEENDVGIYEDNDSDDNDEDSFEDTGN